MVLITKTYHPTTIELFLYTKYITCIIPFNFNNQLDGIGTIMIWIGNLLCHQTTYHVLGLQTSCCKTTQHSLCSKLYLGKGEMQKTRVSTEKAWVPIHSLPDSKACQAGYSAELLVGFHILYLQQGIYAIAGGNNQTVIQVQSGLGYQQFITVVWKLAPRSQKS